MSWFARCFPKPPARTPAPEELKGPRTRRSSRTSFGEPLKRPELPTAGEAVGRSSGSGDEGSGGWWWALTLALAALARSWNLDLPPDAASRVHDAAFVFLAIGVLQLWLRWRGPADEGGGASGGVVGGSRSTSARGRSTMALASESEDRVIVQVKRALRAPPSPAGLTDDDKLLDVQLLRFVREHGLRPAKVEACFRKMLEWKATTFADPMYDALKAGRDQRPATWMSAAQMPHGDWAKGYVSIAMNASVSKHGNPVKIERIGAFDIAGIEKCKGGTQRLAQFYLGLVEHLANRLDYMSVQEERLQQTYEIFDLAGLSWSIAGGGAINFTKDVLLAFSTHYPSSFRKACIINAPSFIGWLWGIFSKVLPASVNSKVNILGKDYERVLQEDLTPEALAWVKSSQAALMHAPHPVPQKGGTETEHVGK